MIAEMEERPPYVRFEQRAIEDRAKSIESGIFSYKDKDFVLVMAHGSRDVFEDDAENWLSKQEAHARNGRIPKEHYEYFKKAYASWKEGQEMPIEGTPIKAWAVLSPAQQNTVIQANIRTVEDLALAPEGALHEIGMGARALKQKAQAWLDTAQTGKGAEKIVDLESKLQLLADENEKLQKQLIEFMSEAEKTKPRRGRPPKEE